MKIMTSYTVKIKTQYITEPRKKGGIKAFTVTGKRRVDGQLMALTAETCLAALKFCVETFLAEWPLLETYPTSDKKGCITRRRKADLLIHSTKDNEAKYSAFDVKFANMPAYMRRSIITDALGCVQSYISNHKNWESTPEKDRGAEPVIGYPSYYELTFFEQERDTSRISEGIIQLKLFNGKTWDWYAFGISPSDAKHISLLAETRKMASPTVEKTRGGYCIRFAFSEEKELIPAEAQRCYTVLAVDLGINAPASWCVMTPDGSVHAKGVIHLPCDEGRLRRMIGRKRKYQRAGKKSKCVYRWLKDANKLLSIHTAQELIRIAILYDVECIVFEHLDHKGKKGSGRLKERLHMWRAADVQERVELQAHRNGMRISRVCAWGTSKYAFDGSGVTDRKSVYRYVHGEKKYNYSLATFKNGKVYNCDLSAAQNIGARYYLRIYAKIKGCPELPPTSQRTLATLRDLMQHVYNGMPTAA